MRLACCAALLISLPALGCMSSPVDPSGRQNTLEDAQRRYTRAVRWGQLEKASQFVDPALRQDFLRHGPELDTVRFSDFEVGNIQRDKNVAHVTVTYEAYSLTTARTASIEEQQHWFRDDGLDNVWRVRSELPEQIAALLSR